MALLLNSNRRRTMNYCIELDPRTDPDPLNFCLRKKEEAAAEIALTLGIILPLTKVRLRNSGVRRILCGGREIPLEVFAEGTIIGETQTKLLAIVETWNLSEEPEFRGFRCA